MRTTLTIDPALARELKKLAHEEKKSFKEIVNRTLKAGIESGRRQVRRKAPFAVEARPCGVRPGVDIGKLNQLVDELEADDAAAETARDLP